MELLPENAETWEFLCLFPGTLAVNGMSSVLRVDYGAVRELAAAVGIAHPAGLIVQLEAVARGYNSKR